MLDIFYSKFNLTNLDNKKSVVLIVVKSESASSYVSLFRIMRSAGALINANKSNTHTHRQSHYGSYGANSLFKKQFYTFR